MLILGLELWLKLLALEARFERRLKQTERLPQMQASPRNRGLQRQKQRVQPVQGASPFDSLCLPDLLTENSARISNVNSQSEFICAAKVKDLL